MDPEGRTTDLPETATGLEARRLALVAGGLIIAVILAAVVIVRSGNHGSARSEPAIAAAEVSPAPQPLSAPRTAAPPPVSGPSVTAAAADGGFGATQDDAKGYDGTAWGASAAEVAKRRDKVTATFSDDDGQSGPPGLATILWVGIGLPANHAVAQAQTFDPGTWDPGAFSTVRHGRTQYVFVHGRFAMAIENVNAWDLDKIRQKTAEANEQIPSLHAEQTFDLSPPGSGLPPEALSSDCYRKAGTNTRIYVIEKWSTTVMGAVRNDRGWVVTIPNAEYQQLLAQAGKTPAVPQ
ncbi:MAG TPA: hypothetical protein VIY53_18570 [Acidobacteriaceae bacterium]